MTRITAKHFTMLSLFCIYATEYVNALSITQTHRYPVVYMNITSCLPSSQNLYCNVDNDSNIIETYFKNFEILSKSEKWEDIIAQGAVALDVAKKSNRYSDEAKISAQLTSTAFYMGNYDQALIFATRCHELAEKFEEPYLFIRALYLESAVHRALAAKEKDEKAQQACYLLAVEICEKASSVYSKMDIKNLPLKGKIFFNLGAAHADNPKGCLDRAESCYIIALECFKGSNATEDVIRTSLRLGKIYLLQNQFDRCQQILNEMRPLISYERISMQADYLEAQLKFAMNDFNEALRIASTGLEKARILGAKEDELRLSSLLHKIQSSLNSKN